MKRITVLLMVVVFIAGCSVIPIGLSYSSTPLENPDGSHAKYKILGKSEGSQGYFSLFSFIPFGETDFKEAIADATKKYNGDAMINVRYWHRSTNYIIGTYTSVQVEGDVIKFKQR